MPVRYSDQSAGPSTRRAYGEEWGSSGLGFAVTSSSQMTKAALQDLAASRGLSTSGTKAQLIDRLAGVEGS
jgi:hypothetical protein